MDEHPTWELALTTLNGVVPVDPQHTNLLLPPLAFTMGDYLLKERQYSYYEAWYKHD
jgi:hypothetical protein